MKIMMFILLLLTTSVISQESNTRFLSILNRELSSFRYIATENDTTIWEEPGPCLEVFPTICFFQSLRIAPSETFVLYEISRTEGDNLYHEDSTVTFKDSGTVVFVGIDSVMLHSTHTSSAIQEPRLDTIGNENEGI